MKKRKVSFDLDSELLTEIKEYCHLRDLKLSDYFRRASAEKLDRDRNGMAIYVGLQKFVIFRKNYEIELFDAEPNVIELVPDAVHEGELRKKEGVTPDDVFGSRGTSLNTLLDNLEEGKSILFLTRERYG